MGNTTPSTDVLAEIIQSNADIVAVLIAETRGNRKTRAVLMVLAAICSIADTNDVARLLAARIESLSSALELALSPATPDACWGRGAAFGLAMEHARRVVRLEQTS
jgi:hypothetical protein